MNEIQANYNTIVVDLGSGVIKAGFTGEDGPRSVFDACVGIPKMPGLLVGMEQRERYVGEDALNKLDIMNFNRPIKNGEIVDWNKLETLLHHLFYSELKVTPEEISILITENPLINKDNRAKLAETLFETFNIEKLHIANTAMLGLYSYGKTSGLVLDSGFGVTSCVPVYEGYPLPHASIKHNFGGDELTEILYSMIQTKLPKSYLGIKGKLITSKIKETLGYIAVNCEEEEKQYSDYIFNYTLPDGSSLKLGSELFKHCEPMFRAQVDNITPVSNFIIDSLNNCDQDIIGDIKENICLTGGTTLMKGYTDRLKNELLSQMTNSDFNILASTERQYANWIGGSIISSLANFEFMWVSKQDYDEAGNSLEAIESKCF